MAGACAALRRRRAAERPPAPPTSTPRSRGRARLGPAASKACTFTRRSRSSALGSRAAPSPSTSSPMNSRAAPQRCSRTRNALGDDAETRPMAAKIVGRTRVEGGRTVREIKYVTVDFELSSEDGFATEARGEDGIWHLIASQGYGIQTIHGALSSADARVARWGGFDADHSALLQRSGRMAGMRGRGRAPVRPLRGGARDDCRALSLSGHSISHGSRPVTCHDACPQYPESPSIKRLRLLSAHSALWVAEKGPLSTVPSLYKSREDCLREHPQVHRARTR